MIIPETILTSSEIHWVPKYMAPSKIWQMHESCSTALDYPILVFFLPLLLSLLA